MEQEKKQSEVYQGKAVLKFVIASGNAACALYGISMGGLDHGILGVAMLGGGILSVPFAGALFQFGLQNTLSAHRAAAREEAEADRQATAQASGTAPRP